MIVADPLAGIAFDAELSVIDEPLGASKGAFSQPTVRSAATTVSPTAYGPVKRGIM